MSCLSNLYKFYLGTYYVYFYMSFHSNGVLVNDAKYNSESHGLPTYCHWNFKQVPSNPNQILFCLLKVKGTRKGVCVCSHCMYGIYIVSSYKKIFSRKYLEL